MLLRSAGKGRRGRDSPFSTGSKGRTVFCASFDFSLCFYYSRYGIMAENVVYWMNSVPERRRRLK